MQDILEGVKEGEKLGGGVLSSLDSRCAVVFDTLKKKI